MHGWPEGCSHLPLRVAATSPCRLYRQAVAQVGFPSRLTSCRWASPTIQSVSLITPLTVKRRPSSMQRAEKSSTIVAFAVSPAFPARWWPAGRGGTRSGERRLGKQKPSWTKQAGASHSPPACLLTIQATLGCLVGQKRALLRMCRKLQGDAQALKEISELVCFSCFCCSHLGQVKITHEEEPGLNFRALGLTAKPGY